MSQKLEAELAKVKEKNAQLREALENIMHHQEHVTGGRGVKLSATWNIAKKALEKIKELEEG